MFRVRMFLGLPDPGPVVRGSVADLDLNPDPDPPDLRVLGLLDPDPDPLVRGMDPDQAPEPDSSIIKQNE
jgi:hypothetical protein